MNEMMERTPEVIAAEIGAIRSQTRQVVLSAAMEIGKRLIEAKAMLPHGTWGGYLEKLEYSGRTAENLMRVYEEYGKNPNPQAFANLSYSKAVALLALDGEQREALMEEKPVADMSVRKLQEEIEAIRAEAEARQVTIDQLTGDLEKERGERERMEQGTRDALARAESAAKEMCQAKEQRKAAEEQIKAAEAQIKAAKLEAEHAQARAREAEQALQEKPEPEKVIETVEVVPAEVEAELERLRKVAAKAPNESVIRFRAEYERLVKQFEAVRGLLEEMSEEDSLRYRSAVKKAALAMAERMG